MDNAIVFEKPALHRGFKAWIYKQTMHAVYLEGHLSYLSI